MLFGLLMGLHFADSGMTPSRSNRMGACHRLVMLCWGLMHVHDGQYQSRPVVPQSFIWDVIVKFATQEMAKTELRAFGEIARAISASGRTLGFW